MSDAHFFLHHNPCQQTLVSRLIEKLSSEGKGSIFKQSTVIVRNQGMATWIKQQIANAECQIMMQVNFPQPNTFLSNLFPTPSVKSETLLWKIYETLPKVIHSSSFRLLKEYLSEPSTTLSHLKQYQLASTIADLYEKYLLYRPEWIEQWNKNQSVMNGIHEQWQRQLWNAIGGRDLYHWSQEIKNLNQQCDASQLPESVHIFGVSSFAPAYLNFLYSLSHRIPVHLYWLNPVDGYWADIPNKRDWILKNSFTEEVDPFSQNPLLASFGRMGREYVHNIYGGKKNEYLIQEEDFITNSDTTSYSLLENLHHSLRSNIVPVQSDFQDNSIQIHACHSPMREVETLKDYLLGNSINNSTDTSDILVLCTDIKTYAPAVEAVFGSHNANSEKQLPFRIADRNSPIDNPNISVIPQLLRLRSSRFTNQDALHILQTPAILERFKLNKSDIPIITNWINNNGIRWGFSKEHVQQKIDVNIKSHWTWQEGLNRLLIGLTISGNDDKSRLWNGISPFIEVEGANLKLASSLCDYVQWCHSIYTDLGKELRLSEWIESCRNWVNEGFSSLDDFQSQLH